MLYGIEISAWGNSYMNYLFFFRENVAALPSPSFMGKQIAPLLILQVLDATWGFHCVLTEGVS